MASRQPARHRPLALILISKEDTVVIIWREITVVSGMGMIDEGSLKS